MFNGPTNDQLIGSDFTDSGNDLSIVAADGNRLLGRLELEHFGSITPGATFTLSIQNSPDTFFEDMAFNPATITAGSFGAAGNGTITTTAAAAIPEPSTILLTAVGTLGYGFTQRRRRKNQVATGETATNG